jgi:outer membrane protein insertion porin family
LSGPARKYWFIAATVLLCLWLCVNQALAQGVEATGRPVSVVQVQGVNQVPVQLVLNQVRQQAGQPYDPQVVKEDIVRITYLGRFAKVDAKVKDLPDGSVVLTYVVDEQPLLTDVKVVGNKQLYDGELLKLVVLKTGDPADPFLIDRGIQEIKRAYAEKGYFVTDVTVDKQLLAETNILLFEVREGPRPRIRKVAFEGNTTYKDSQLKSKIRTKRHIFILQNGDLNKEVIDMDISKLRDFYQERGYLDVDVGRRIDISPNQNDAIVTFVINEGKQYLVDKITIQGNSIFNNEQVLEVLKLKIGDVFSDDRVKKSEESVYNIYGNLGYLAAEDQNGTTRVKIDRLFHENEPKVDVVVTVWEGKPYTVGRVIIQGNDLTKDKIVLRQLRGMDPGKRYVGPGVKNSLTALKESALFSDATVTIQGDPKDDVRDVLVQVKEANTGSISFGAAVSSDAGIVGAVDIVQRNFDIADLPQSPGEAFTGKAFRGAGQYFALNLAPGAQVSTYSISFREPYLFDTNKFVDANVFYFSRSYNDYNEERVGANGAFGTRFGNIYSAAVKVRGENITIEGVSPSAPIDVWETVGSNVLTNVGFVVIRSTVDSRLLPTRGSRTTVGFNQYGALGGDYTFQTVDFDWRKYWTVEEDFFGRRSVLSNRFALGYVLTGDAPVFERYYAGGSKSMRGFQFRGVGPVGIRYDTLQPSENSVGGNFLFLYSVEYTVPIFQDILRWAVFTDTGTVDTEVSLSKYRVAVGTGLRIKIPFLGQAPFALDFAIPLVKQDTDQTQLLSFDLSVPF